MKTVSVEAAVSARYSQAAKAPEAALCCPVSYDSKYLEAIPREVIEKDYGCGNPARYLEPGETVLDLGSGTGKICFIAAQVVGPRGRVIGIDMTDEMLEVARRNAPVVAEKLGYSNVEFRKGRIQDLALDPALFDQELRSRPARDMAGWLRAEEAAARLRREAPLVPDESIDVVVSNCVLNLVESRAKGLLFSEIFRVLKPGGRAVISDIVSSRPVPLAMRNDAELWSGCISGALTEERFASGFTQAEFGSVEIVERQSEPWRVVEGIVFRSVTIRAVKSAPASFVPLKLPELNEAACRPPSCCS